MNKTEYRYRHIARIMLEATTPIAVGSGMSDILTDSPVIRDVNGLPYIPATSLAGVIRHSLDLKDDDSNIFGYHDKSGGLGSRVVFTDAIMVGEKGEVLDGIQNIDWSSPFYSHYQELCVRQHVRIGHTGVAENRGKFDNEVVFQGTRFVFELEVVSDKDQEADFENALSRIHQESFRVGGGTRRGYGQLKVERCGYASLDLTKKEDLQAYLGKSSNLNKEWSAFQPWAKPHDASQDWVRYQLNLHPQDFFLFGSGMGDDDADNVSVTEAVVTWDGGKPNFEDRRVLIPTSSVKGALSHRTAYHYNKRKGCYADNLAIDEFESHVGGNNVAVRNLFGYAADEKEDKTTKRGNVLLSDVFLSIRDDEKNAKVFYHNKIDYFTGGTINGALFQEKTVYGKGCSFQMEILVHKAALEDDDVREAFEHSLRDLCAGLLPLGGATGRGNGIFEGSYNKKER